MSGRKFLSVLEVGHSVRLLRFARNDSSHTVDARDASVMLTSDCFASLAMTAVSLRGARRATKQSTVPVRPVVASAAKQPFWVPGTDIGCAQ